MTRFGVCVPLKLSAEARQQGWDFTEDNVQSLFTGKLPDAEYTGLEKVKAAALPVAAANCLVPGDLKITGEAADLAALKAYMTNVLRRAGEAGTKTLVFGSGGARNVPEHFDRQRARQQIIEFASMSATLAANYGVTLVVEPLNRGECNIINSVGEAMDYVRTVNHPNLKCLVDTFHFWKESEPLEHLKEAASQLRHVHVADLAGRVGPGLSGTSDYRPVFAILKAAGYTGAVSVEAIGFDLARDGNKVLAHLRRAWEEA
jgi:sugar phosphate isomerase/epimerase